MTTTASTPSTARRAAWHLVLGAALLAAAGNASALDFGKLKDMAGGLGGGGASESSGGSMLPGSLGSLMPGSLGNAAGVVQYCIQNNYLGGNNAQSMKDKLMGKLTGSTGQPAQQDPGYASGIQGLLDTGDGNKVDLNGGGSLKETITKKVCEKVLDNAKSLI